MHIVLSTIIILVASVTLASAVVLYGTSLFQSATQQESFTVFSTKLWGHSSDDYVWFGEHFLLETVETKLYL